MQPLVSIIIPSYNRENLIGETLDTIILQTYTNWECIIVDDKSLDDSLKVVGSYCEKDPRFKLLVRPENRLKGANACRNVGLENAQGDFVIFFDSVDLMTTNHIEFKMNVILNNDCDYVITKTEFFNKSEDNYLLERHYNFKSKDVNAYNYVAHNIGWLTYDTCIKANLAKSISFNEALSSGQEFNYFTKLTLKSSKAIFKSETLTLRRFHEDSIRGELRADKIKSFKSFYNTYWHTYIDTKDEASKPIKIILIHRCATLAYRIPYDEIPFRKQLFKFIKKDLGLKGIYHILQIQLRRFKR
nr:glycosyltransferase family 2 protein [uncultured Psychroserpens sp.]